MEEPIIETIIETTALLKDCKLDMDAVSNHESILRLNEYFQTSSIETIIMVSIFQLSAESKRIDREDMATYLGCNPILFFKYEENFNALYKRGYLKNQSRFRRKFEYELSDTLHDCIINNKKPDIPEQIQKNDPIEILSDFVRIIEDRENNNGNTVLLINQLDIYFHEYQHIPFFRELSVMGLLATDKLSLLLLIERNITGTKSMAIETIGDKVFSKSSERIHFSNSLHDKSNDLTSENWIDFTEGGFVNSARVKLTSKTKEFLKPLGITINLDEDKDNKQLLLPETIHRKKLFYNLMEAEQIGSVSKSLMIRNHTKIKKRLSSQGFRTGICTLLYGAPGTGKTESVYQIARQTGRPLWKVDLTELKSMWFGESQKKVKALFENYKELCKEEKRTPILLLNEADAILGTRQSNATGGSEAANNAIQNIFLDCLEDFEGILFATTNLEKSLDPAFERRFLFKIKFERPEANAQQQIWKAMLKELSTPQARTLAEKFNLSGGEIENVLRKLAMMRVLEDKINVFENVKRLCETEQLGLKVKPVAIGF